MSNQILLIGRSKKLNKYLKKIKDTLLNNTDCSINFSLYFKKDDVPIVFTINKEVNKATLFLETYGQKEIASYSFNSKTKKDEIQTLLEDLCKAAFRELLQLDCINDQFININGTKFDFESLTLVTAMVENPDGDYRLTKNLAIRVKFVDSLGEELSFNSVSLFVKYILYLGFIKI